MNTRMTQFLRSDPAMYTSPGRTYVRVGVRDPARMYVRGRIYFLAPWPLYVRVHAACVPLLWHMCAPLLQHVRTFTSTSMYVYVHDQNDNATYASTRWVPTVRHFLACEDVAGGSQQSGGESFFLPVIWTHFLAREDVPGGSQQSGGENIIFQGKKDAVACMRPHCQPLTYSHLPMTTARPQTGTTRRWGRCGSGVADGEEWET